MELLKLPERPNWRDRARDLGFNFADMYGEPYWDEGHVWRFTMDQIEGCIEDPCTELHALFREAVGRIIGSEALMVRMGTPRTQWDFIADSWARAEPELYGRFDLAFDGTGPAKLLEYNADTPTSLYESSAFQWLWLEDQMKAGVLPEAADQFNGIHEALVERFGKFLAQLHDKKVYFRSLHLGNVLLMDDGEFALIDIADMRIYPSPLRNALRQRNLRHMQRYPEDRRWLFEEQLPELLQGYATLASPTAVEGLRQQVAALTQMAKV